MKAYRFVHLNVHSHYSINDGCASIRELVDAAIKERMPGIAITDTGNMFGIIAYSGDTRSPIPVISVHSVGNLQYRRQS